MAQITSHTLNGLMEPMPRECVSTVNGSIIFASKWTKVVAVQHVPADHIDPVYMAGFDTGPWAEQGINAKAAEGYA